MMNLSDLKVYLLNITTLTISFTAIEDGVKMILLLVSLGYTLQKWYIMHNDNKAKKDE